MDLEELEREIRMHRRGRRRELLVLAGLGTALAALLAAAAAVAAAMV